MVQRSQQYWQHFKGCLINQCKLWNSTHWCLCFQILVTFHRKSPNSQLLYWKTGRCQFGPNALNSITRESISRIIWTLSKMHVTWYRQSRESKLILYRIKVPWSIPSNRGRTVPPPIKAHSVVCLDCRGKKPTEHEPGTDFSFLLTDSNPLNP